MIIEFLSCPACSQLAARNQGTHLCATLHYRCLSSYTVTYLPRNRLTYLITYCTSRKETGDDLNPCQRYEHQSLGRFLLHICFRWLRIACPRPSPRPPRRGPALVFKATAGGSVCSPPVAAASGAMNGPPRRRISANLFTDRKVWCVGAFAVLAVRRVLWQYRSIRRSCRRG